MISRGERPSYTARTTQDGRWKVVGLPWLAVDATTRQGARDAARAALAAMLEVEPDRLDVELG